jgi:hypothetical protein
MPLIRIETLIAAPAVVCFDVMRDATVHIRSVAHTGERAVAGRASGLFEAGDEVTWEARSRPSSTSIDFSIRPTGP